VVEPETTEAGVGADEPAATELARRFWHLCARLARIYPSRPRELAPESEPATIARGLRDLAAPLAAGLVANPHWLGDASVGQGAWATVPWVGFFDRRSSSGSGEGVYPSVQILWKGDSGGVRLALNLSADYGSSTLGEKQTAVLERLTQGSRDELTQLGFRIVDQREHDFTPALVEPGMVRLPRSFWQSAILECVVPLAELEADPAGATARLAALLRCYLRWVNQGGLVVDDDALEQAHAIQDLGAAQSALQLAARRRGLVYPRSLQQAFLISLKSKPFCLLAGPTGTGKSCLARLLEDLGARVAVAPVDPGWTDGRPLLGARDPHGRFELGILTELAQSAARQPARLHLLVLDELNLARPERYLAQWLSVVESRRLEGGQVTADPLLTRTLGQQVLTPPNLCVIGTLNMDESDGRVSHRVLDRANVLALTSPSELLPARDEADGSAGGVLDARVFSTQVLTWEDVRLAADPETAQRIEAAIRDVLQPTQDALSAHLCRVRISYRLRDEISAYLYHGLSSGLAQPEELDRLLDQQLRQRLLPKLLDGRQPIRPALADDLHRLWSPLCEDGAAAIVLAVSALEAELERPVSMWEVLS